MCLYSSCSLRNTCNCTRTPCVFWRFSDRLCHTHAVNTCACTGNPKASVQQLAVWRQYPCQCSARRRQRKRQEDEDIYIYIYIFIYLFYFIKKKRTRPSFCYAPASLSHPSTAILLPSFQKSIPFFFSFFFSFSHFSLNPCPHRSPVVEQGGR